VGYTSISTKKKESLPEVRNLLQLEAWKQNKKTPWDKHAAQENRYSSLNDALLGRRTIKLLATC